jgi:hypothetical protein
MMRSRWPSKPGCEPPPVSVRPQGALRVRVVERPDPGREERVGMLLGLRARRPHPTFGWGLSVLVGVSNLATYTSGRSGHKRAVGVPAKRARKRTYRSQWTYRQPAGVRWTYAPIGCATVCYDPSTPRPRRLLLSCRSTFSIAAVRVAWSGCVPEFHRIGLANRFELVCLDKPGVTIHEWGASLYGRPRMGHFRGLMRSVSQEFKIGSN